MDATGGYSSPARHDWSLELLRDADGAPLALELASSAHVLRMKKTDGKGCNLDYYKLVPVPG